MITKEILLPGILAAVSVGLIIIGVGVVMGTKDGASWQEMDCSRDDFTIRTTMYELRKPGPYVVGILEDGRSIAVAKDGLRCNKVD